MSNKNLIIFLATIPIVNSYVYAYNLYYSNRFDEFTQTIVNIPYYIICSIMFYFIINAIYAPDKIEILYVYLAIVCASILNIVLSINYPNIIKNLNSYIPIIPKNL